MLHTALAAAEQAAQQGLSVEVIDLRTIWPWDRELVLASAARTGRLLVAHEAVQAAGFGAEIAATVAEELGIPVRRVGAPRIPVGYARTLEDAARISAQQLLHELNAFRRTAPATARRSMALARIGRAVLRLADRRSKSCTFELQRSRK